ncbi:MAG: hypothetical protein HKN49_07700, partial [Gammaproteobacteria bacterium]|nr:hypothetical protein [Gammaproteobacteria bacterium]
GGGNDVDAERHRQLHAKYKPDDNARDRAIAIARRNDRNANHAADAVVIYDLHLFDEADALAGSQPAGDSASE